MVLLHALTVIERVDGCTGWISNRPNDKENLAVSDFFQSIEVLVLEILQFALNTSI